MKRKSQPTQPTIEAMMTQDAPALLPPQTAKRRKVVKKWDRQYGLNARELAAADKVRAELVANPFMKHIQWDEVLGSNEWKMQVWKSLTSGKVATVEIVIGEAVPE